jgi:aspartate racemase
LRASNEFTHGNSANAGSGGRCLGLIGGLGVGATIYYYRRLVEAHALRHAVPSLIIDHADVNHVLAEAAAGHTRELAKYLATFIERMAQAGAQLVAIPSVTPHICSVELLESSPIPLVHLPNEILREIHANGFRRVALFGTRFTVETDMFGLLPSVDVVRPQPNEIELIHSTYIQLVNSGSGSVEQYRVLRQIADSLFQRDHVEAIVFAGTDLSLVFDETNTDFPHIDGSRIHLAAIMRELFAP